MITVERIDTWGFEQAVPREIIDYFISHYTGRGYRQTKSGKYEVCMSPTITVTSEKDAIVELCYRHINKLQQQCLLYGLSLQDAVIYKDILVFPSGQFISLNRCKLMRQTPPKDTSKYLWINTGHSKQEQAHRVVAKCFIPNPLNRKCVNYKNGIKTDNRVENLEWCTHSENTIHSFMTGLQQVIGNQYGTYEVKKYDNSRKH